jgi:hypothetical protein
MAGKLVRVSILEVTSTDDPFFRKAFELLRASFKRVEMAPIRDWRMVMREREEGLWTDTAWHLFVAHRGPQVLGAASGTYLGNVNVGLVGYVALSAAHRSSGLGPRLRRRLGKQFERDAERIAGKRLEAIVGEVDAENPWLRHLVRREGAIALDFEYFQPARGSKRSAIPLVLYYQSLRKPRISIGVPRLRRLLYTMWRRWYRVADPLSKPEFRKMLASLEGRRRIGQRKLAKGSSSRS